MVHEPIPLGQVSNQEAVHPAYWRRVVLRLERLREIAKALGVESRVPAPSGDQLVEALELRPADRGLERAHPKVPRQPPVPEMPLLIEVVRPGMPEPMGKIVVVGDDHAPLA